MVFQVTLITFRVTQRIDIKLIINTIGFLLAAPESGAVSRLLPGVAVTLHWQCKLTPNLMPTTFSSTSRVSLILSIHLNVPEGWHDLGDKQLRYVYQLFAQDFTSDEVKTHCLLQWIYTKAIGRQDIGSYLLKRGKIIFEVTPYARLVAYRSRKAFED